MRVFFLCIFILFSMVPRAQADTAIEVFKREFVERYLETFYKGEPFDFAGLNCKSTPTVAEKTACVNSDGDAMIQVRNIDRDSNGRVELWKGVGLVLSNPPNPPEADWSIRSKTDMDQIVDIMAEWAKSKPGTTIGDFCIKPTGDDDPALTDVRRYMFNVVSSTGERGYLIGVIFSTEFGNMVLFSFMRGEGFCG
ncbi:MAG: hypothetical protein U1A24_15925 [Cypionkella sp.]|uniref:hypothetical protein n=1 Tax=Cypionkella sp. TaxID=2811411 RepID=UPI002ABAA7F2|nr:hypothetical protein [Cypionkella sp.]MDZ4312035.1 hypothetical protein [Cypionkella sp.]